MGHHSLAHIFYDGSGALPKGLQNGQVHAYLAIGDHLGSSSFVLDHDTGELVERITYRAYGGVESDYRQKRWNNFREDVRYSDHWDDSPVGLTYFGARYYSPQLARFISPDPETIHQARGDLNPYAFVMGSPLGRVDPFGLDPVAPVTDPDLDVIAAEEAAASTYAAASASLASPGACFCSNDEALGTLPAVYAPSPVAAPTVDPYAAPALAASAGGFSSAGTVSGGFTLPSGSYASAEYPSLVEYYPASTVPLQIVFTLGTSGIAPLFGGGADVALGATTVAETSADLAAEGLGGAADDTITLYHGSVDNFSGIMQNGLEAARTPTWVTTDLEAAQNAIGPGRVLSAGQGLDTDVVTSTVPLSQFQAIQEAGGISELRSWPGFGGGQTFGEYVLRSPDAIDLFNQGIVR